MEVKVISSYTSREQYKREQILTMKAGCYGTILWGVQPLEEQLKKLGFRFRIDADPEFYEDCNVLLPFLNKHGFMTDSQLEHVLKRVYSHLWEDAVERVKDLEIGYGDVDLDAPGKPE